MYNIQDGKLSISLKKAEEPKSEYTKGSVASGYDDSLHRKATEKILDAVDYSKSTVSLCPNGDIIVVSTYVGGYRHVWNSKKRKFSRTHYRV